MPQCLLEGGLAEIQDRVRSAPSVSLFLSFDGALTGLVEDPEDAGLAQATRDVLEVLSKRPDILTVILSGRALSDLERRAGISGVVYAGNHGLEIGGRGLRFVEPFAAARTDILARISDSLAANLKGVFGVRVEYKGLTTSVHYRQASAADFQDIERIVQAIVAPGVSPFCVDVGKMALEVIPRTDWHTGAAVCWINSRLAGKGAACIYVGDDRSDEAAFQRLPDEITVCVGNPEWSSARYYLSDPAEVREFLVWLNQSR
ncbi:MAG: trehalose-phosphatase [Acidobacteriia bacterium]|nr:trehalose-phosphatase [Terriglobia bacterium]